MVLCAVVSTHSKQKPFLHLNTDKIPRLLCHLADVLLTSWGFCVKKIYPLSVLLMLNLPNYIDEKANLAHGFRGLSPWSVGSTAFNLVRQDITVGACDIGSALHPGRGGRGKERTTVLFNSMPQ